MKKCLIIFVVFLAVMAIAALTDKEDKLPISNKVAISIAPSK